MGGGGGRIKLSLSMSIIYSYFLLLFHCIDVFSKKTYTDLFVSYRFFLFLFFNMKTHSLEQVFSFTCLQVSIYILTEL